MTTSIDQIILAPDVLANRPAAGSAGRIFPATDTGLWYRDNGISWDVIPPVQSANTVLAGPTSGAAAAPAYRALVAADVPHHASTHLRGGADDLFQLTRSGEGPGVQNLIAETADTYYMGSGSAAPPAGQISLYRINTDSAYTLNTIAYDIATAGSGTTSLANCFIGIYSSDGVRRFVSADLTSSFQSSGMKTLTVTGGYAVTGNDAIYIALLVGTQSTTNVALRALQPGSITNTNPAGATGTGLKAARQLTGQTSLPASITFSSSGTTNVLLYFAIF